LSKKTSVASHRKFSVHLYKDRTFLVRFVSVALLSLINRFLEPTFIILAKSRSIKLSLTGFLENFSAHRGSLKHAVSMTVSSFLSIAVSFVSSWVSDPSMTSLLYLLSFKSLPLALPSSLGFFNGGSLGPFCNCCLPPTRCC